MRKVVLQLGLTLDGFMCGPNGELDWMVFDQQLLAYNMELAKQADITLMGHNAYNEMSGYWSDLPHDPTASKLRIEFAEVLNAMKKIIFVSADEKLVWRNAEAAVVHNGDDIAKIVNELKTQPGKDIIVYGGVQTAHTLIQHGLVDEYQLTINPVVLGKGRLLFSDINDQMKLKLVSTRSYECGAVGLAYHRI